MECWKEDTASISSDNEGYYSDENDENVSGNDALSTRSHTKSLLEDPNLLKPSIPGENEPVTGVARVPTDTYVLSRRLSSISIPSASSLQVPPSYSTPTRKSHPASATNAKSTKFWDKGPS